MRLSSRRTAGKQESGEFLFGFVSRVRFGPRLAFIPFGKLFRDEAAFRLISVSGRD